LVIIFICFVNSLYTLILLVSLFLLLFSSISISLVFMGSIFSCSCYLSGSIGFAIVDSEFILGIIPSSFIFQSILLFLLFEGFLFSFSPLFFYFKATLTSLCQYASIFRCLMFLISIDSLDSPLVVFTSLS